MPTVNRALIEAGIEGKDLTAIGVTRGPGLIGSLLDLGYSGGPVIDRLAKEGSDVLNFPRPMSTASDSVIAPHAQAIDPFLYAGMLTPRQVHSRT